MDSVEVDGQGRVSLIPILRSHALLEKEAVLVGASTRFEIWSRKLWDEYISKEKDQVEDLAQLLVGGPVEE